MRDPLPRFDADHCFVCGPLNPHGLQITFTLEDGVCRGHFTPGPFHGGFENVTHGGIVFSVLDDAMANWLLLQGARGLTAKCEIRYREPLPVGASIDIEARLQRRKRRLVVLTSSVKRCDNQHLIAEAEASFMLEDQGQLAASTECK